MDSTKALELLKGLVKNGKPHQDYDRTVKLRDQYKALISGEGIEQYLKRFAKREDEELFKQRCEITQAITPAICESILTPFYKVSRTNRVFQSLNSKDAEAVKRIQSGLKTFWGEGDSSGLDLFMQTRWVELSFTDPNAFIAVEFDSFDPLNEVARPKPVEISCENVYRFDYKNNVLQWLLAKWPIKYQRTAGKPEDTADGSRYVMYLENEALELIQVDAKTKITKDADPGAVFVEITKTEVYQLKRYEPKSGLVPCLRVGYKRDLATDGRTYVSPLQPALPYLMKTLKTVSEMDLSMLLHVFPQKFQYVQPCTGESGKGCTQGKTRTGSVCQSCKGTGTSAIHTSAQDAILLPIPRDKESFLPLDGMAAYKAPPIELVEFQKKYIDALKQDAIRAIFNGDTLIKNTTAATATERELDMEAVYDTLTPFARKYSLLWMSIVKLVAVYTDSQADDLEIYHKFPSDFKLKSMATLLSELQLANQSNAPSYVISALNADMMEMVYMDDPDTLEKMKVKQKFYPFSGRTAMEIQMILAADLTTRYNKVLYSNFEDIFDQIEFEVGDKFYLLATAKQQEEIKKRVELLIAEIDKSKAQPFNINAPGGENTL